MNAQPHKRQDLTTGLRPGMAFRHLSTDEDIMARLALSSGSELHLGEGYVPNALVPRNDWRHINAADRKALAARSAYGGAAHGIYLWKVPERIMDCFAGLRRSIIKYNDERLVKNLLDHPDFKRGRAALIALINGVGVPVTDRSFGHYTRPTGLATTSVGDDDRFVGLHLDSRHKLDLVDRSEGLPNRLVINMGPESRYLLLVNLSLPEMYDMLGEVVKDGVSFVPRFFAAYPDYPVLRLEIRPGEAYVAPTEIMIHDATTLEKQYLDASYTFLGDFGFDVVQRLAAIRD